MSKQAIDTPQALRLDKVGERGLRKKWEMWGQEKLLCRSILQVI